MSAPKVPAAALLASPDDVEAQFYEALQRGDIERLMAIWSDDEEVACVHPGGPRIVGHAAIRASFEAIFANGVIAVQPQSVKRVHALGCAVHHVLECIGLGTGQPPAVAWVLATNVYLKTAQGWRMVVHHASPGTEQPGAPDSERPSTLH